jgi:hypothetical protein
LVRDPGRPEEFARICASAIIANALIDIDPQFPQLGREGKQQLAEARTLLEAELGPNGGRPRNASPEVKIGDSVM